MECSRLLFKEEIVTFERTKGKNKIILVFHHPEIVNTKPDLLTGDCTGRRLAYFNLQKK